MERLETESTGHAILVVEDEDAILRGLCDVLAFQGYAPNGVSRGDDGLEAARAGRYGLIILDVMMPGLDGFQVCEKIRAEDDKVPILMLTARGSEEDILRGFRCGADDYVTKPFSVTQLVARVGALLRRAPTPTDLVSSSGTSGMTRKLLATPAEIPDETPFDFGLWRIFPAEKQARLDDETADLTARDLELITFFALEPGRIISRRRLLSEIWGYPDPERVETRSVDMHIAKLRKKLGPDAGALIETVRGEGYRFRGA